MMLIFYLSEMRTKPLKSKDARNKDTGN